MCLGNPRLNGYIRWQQVDLVLDTNWTERISADPLRVAIQFGQSNGFSTFIWPGVPKSAGAGQILLQANTTANIYITWESHGDLVQQAWYARGNSGTPQVSWLVATVPSRIMEQLRKGAVYF